MQFVILGYDAEDDNAVFRRIAVRENHLELAKENYKKGHLLFAAGLLDDNDKMIGSNMIMEFESKSELDEYLQIEPYMKNKVWSEVKIYQSKVPVFCLK